MAVVVAVVVVVVVAVAGVVYVDQQDVLRGRLRALRWPAPEEQQEDDGKRRQ